jgi:hypothetical protein
MYPLFGNVSTLHGPCLPVPAARFAGPYREVSAHSIFSVLIMPLEMSPYVHYTMNLQTSLRKYRPSCYIRFKIPAYRFQMRRSVSFFIIIPRGGISVRTLARFVLDLLRIFVVFVIVYVLIGLMIRGLYPNSMQDIYRYHVILVIHLGASFLSTLIWYQLKGKKSGWLKN